MKKLFVILTAVALGVSACQSWNEDEGPETVMEPAGAQSHSSDVNPASSSRNVGQSGASTNDLNAPPENGSTNQDQPYNSPQ